MYRNRTTALGVGTIIIGAFLLLVLRLWTSPVARTVTNRDSISMLSFIGIPLFLGLVAIGIGLFLYGDSAGERS